MNRRIENQQGYILIEATVAMVVLSIGALMVHGTMRQSTQTLGQSEDFTQAQLLLSSLMNEIELQPELVEGKKSGWFEEREGRFQYEYTIRKVSIPLPKVPKPVVDPNSINQPRKITFNARDKYLLHVRTVITWTRAGREFEESLETLLNGRQLYVPPAEEPRNEF
jgi:type II secretory pathway pseudopilin PulG